MGEGPERGDGAAAAVDYKELSAQFKSKLQSAARVDRDGSTSDHTSAASVYRAEFYSADDVSGLRGAAGNEDNYAPDSTSHRQGGMRGGWDHHHQHHRGTDSTHSTHSLQQPWHPPSHHGYMGVSVGSTSGYMTASPPSSPFRPAPRPNAPLALSTPSQALPLASTGPSHPLYTLAGNASRAGLDFSAASVLSPVDRGVASAVTQASQRAALMASRLADKSEEVTVLKEMLDDRRRDGDTFQTTLHEREAEIDKAKGTVANLAEQMQHQHAQLQAAQTRTTELEAETLRLQAKATEATAGRRNAEVATEHIGHKLRAAQLETTELRGLAGSLQAAAETSAAATVNAERHHAEEVASIEARFGRLAHEWERVLADRDAEIGRFRDGATAAKETFTKSVTGAEAREAEVVAQLTAARRAVAEHEVTAQKLCAGRDAAEDEAARYKAKLAEDRESAKVEADHARTTLRAERQRLDELSSSANQLLKEITERRVESEANTVEIGTLRRKLREAEDGVAARGNLGAIVEAQIAEIDRARRETTVAFEAAESAEMRKTEAIAARARAEAALVELRKAHDTETAELRSATSQLTREVDTQRKLVAEATAAAAAERHRASQNGSQIALELAEVKKELAGATAARDAIETAFGEKENRYKQLLAALDERQKAWDRGLTTCKDECLARVSTMAAAHREESADLQVLLDEREEQLGTLDRTVTFQNLEHERLAKEHEASLRESVAVTETLRISIADRDATMVSLAHRVRHLDIDLGQTRDALAVAEAKVAASEDRARRLGAGLDGLRRQADLVAGGSSVPIDRTTSSSDSRAYHPSSQLTATTPSRVQERTASADALSESLARLLKSVTTPSRGTHAGAV